MPQVEDARSKIGQAETERGHMQAYDVLPASQSPTDALVNYHGTYAHIIGQDWAEPSEPWLDASHQLWSNDSSSGPSQDGLEEQQAFYSSYSSTDFNYEYYPQVATASAEPNPEAYQSYVRAINPDASTYGVDFDFQTPQDAKPPQLHHTSGTSTFEETDYFQIGDYDANLHFETATTASPWTPLIDQGTHLTHQTQLIADLPIPSQAKVRPVESTGTILDWSASHQASSLSSGSTEFSSPPILPKRKPMPLEPTPKKTKESSREKGFSDCVAVFESAPGALANIKRRRKLDAQVRKAAREVRKAGACHQCRFRKRTVSVQVGSWQGASN